MRVFIGWDERESKAARVAEKTLYEVSGGELKPEFIDAARLTAHGLLTRISDHREGKDYDLVSNAHKSTRFAVSRFLTPLICMNGWALFTDCDVVFLRDPRAMLLDLDPKYAVHVVKHEHHPTEVTKMVDQIQTDYPRKNWSSVMLFNCDHPANQRLTLWDINHRPGRDLHALYWLNNDEIGALYPGWNWLVNVEPRPAAVGIAHFTLGGPWLSGWTSAPNDDIWLRAKGD